MKMWKNGSQKKSEYWMELIKNENGVKSSGCWRLRRLVTTFYSDTTRHSNELGVER